MTPYRENAATESPKPRRPRRWWLWAIAPYMAAVYASAYATDLGAFDGLPNTAAAWAVTMIAWGLVVGVANYVFFGENFE